MKPVVRFEYVDFCEVGCSALVKPIDHESPYVSNTKMARTSTVISKQIDGLDRVLCFETQNTCYKRIGQ